jgi:hypothetical protein
MMEDGCVRTGTHDAGVGRTLGAAGAKHARDLGLDLVLETPGGCDLEGARMRLLTDGRCPGHHGQFGVRLAQPLFVQGLRKVDDLGRCHDAAASPLADRVDRAEHDGVELGLMGEPVVQPACITEVLGQLGREFVDRKHRVDARPLQHAVDARARTIPGLPLGIARSHEHDRAMLGMLGGEDQQALGLVEASQVVEVAVLAVVVLDSVAANLDRSGRKERDTGPDEVEEASPALCELGTGKRHACNVRGDSAKRQVWVKERSGGAHRRRERSLASRRSPHDAPASARVLA